MEATQEQIWLAVDLHANEWDRWGLRHNKTEPYPHEVYRLDEGGEPKVIEGCGSLDVGQYELNEKRAEAAMRAALAAFTDQRTQE